MQEVCFCYVFNRHDRNNILLYFLIHLIWKQCLFH